jgi:hypothetical protein
MKAIAITLCALVLAGCSSFKLGAGCYIPHGVSGQCTAATMEPAQPAPVVAPAGVKKL